MSTTATHTSEYSPSAQMLYLAFELSNSSGKPFFSTGLAQPPRQRSVATANLPALLQEISLARRRFGLPNDAPVLKCDEAAGTPSPEGHRDDVAPSLPCPARPSQPGRRLLEHQVPHGPSHQDRPPRRLQVALHAHSPRFGDKRSGTSSMSQPPSRKTTVNSTGSSSKQERTRHICRIKAFLASCGLRINLSSNFLQQCIAPLVGWLPPFPPLSKDASAASGAAYKWSRAPDPPIRGPRLTSCVPPPAPAFRRLANSCVSRGSENTPPGSTPWNSSPGASSVTPRAPSRWPHPNPIPERR